MSFAYLVSLLLLGSIAFALVREMRKASPRPAGLRGHIRARGWGLLLLPIALMAAVMTGHVHALAVAELAVAGALVTWAPRLAAKLVPYALLALALFGLILAKAYHDGFSSQVLYGLVLAGGGPFRRGFVLPQAGVFFVLGMWLLLRVEAPGAGLVRALIARWLDPRRGGISPRQGLLLIPVTGLAMQLLGPGNWFGVQAITGLDVALIDLGVATVMLVLVFRSRVWAATLAEAGLLVLGGYGLLIIAFWPSVPGFDYGFADLTGPRPWPAGVAVQAVALLALGLWLAPRVMREHEMLPADSELAARAQQLTQRVQTLTRTRSEAVDTAVAELRRIERDLHDGAQARLVAVGMSLQAAERLFASQPRGGSRAGRRGQGELLPGPDRAARPGARHLPAGARGPRSWRCHPGAGAGHAAAHRGGRRPARTGRSAGRLGRLFLGGRGAGQCDEARARPFGPYRLVPGGRDAPGARSPTTARAGPIPRPGPGWPESSAGSRRLMASWR